MVSSNQEYSLALILNPHILILWNTLKWVHKRCSGISRKLRAKDVEAFKCKTCVKGAQGSIKTEAGCVKLDDGLKFELVDKFCYLGDMLCAGGGAEDASRTRVWSAWGSLMS